MIKRGEIYYADLSPVVGSEQGGIRPVVIIQNDIGNRFSPTVIVAPITTTRTGKAQLPTHVHLYEGSTNLAYHSVVLLEQVRTIDKTRLKHLVGTIDEETLDEIDNALHISFGLIDT